MSKKTTWFNQLFGKKQKDCGCNNQQKQSCGCGGCGCSTGTPSQNPTASILVLGSGCANCQKLEQNVHKALEQMGNTTLQVAHITDFTQIASYGVMSTPALVVNGKVVSSGKVLQPEEIIPLLS